jgi:hypothetical protein
MAAASRSRRDTPEARHAASRRRPGPSPATSCPLGSPRAPLAGATTARDWTTPAAKHRAMSHMPNQPPPALLHAFHSRRCSASYELSKAIPGTAAGVARFLLGLYNGYRFPFELTQMRSLGEAVFEDCVRQQATGVSPSLVHLQPSAAREPRHGGADAAAGVDGQDARDGQRLARAVGHTDGLAAGDGVVRQQRVKCCGSPFRAGLPKD